MKYIKKETKIHLDAYTTLLDKQEHLYFACEEEAHQEQDALYRRGARGLLHQPPGLYNCALVSSM